MHSSVLSSARLVAFVSTTKADRARAFYRDTLGLNLISEDNFALQFDCGGTVLRVSLAQEVIPAKYTVLGWSVEDLPGTIAAMQKAGVVFERFGFFKQDDLGIWTAPNGDQVAWFKDPDGNLLSLDHHAAAK
jgi:catechol 2,3-dioxygenase-like lactoylglutathione lyase family enzyme